MKPLEKDQQINITYCRYTEMTLTYFDYSPGESSTDIEVCCLQLSLVVAPAVRTAERNGDPAARPQQSRETNSGIWGFWAPDLGLGFFQVQQFWSNGWSLWKIPPWSAPCFQAAQGGEVKQKMMESHSNVTTNHWDAMRPVDFPILGMLGFAFFTGFGIFLHFKSQVNFLNRLCLVCPNFHRCTSQLCSALSA